MVLHRKIFLNCRVCLACGKGYEVLQRDFLDEVVSFQRNSSDNIVLLDLN